MITVAIAAAANGVNQIVAAVANGRRIRLLMGVLSFSGTVNCKWQSAGNDLTGLYYGAANVVVPFSSISLLQSGLEGHFATNANEALNLFLSGAVAVGGHIVYELVP